jgi:(1->4)-alpha-D-glucan 1-alpha-D-glucosylmutase
MAKGVEDTAFYRYNRLVSLCEVGNEPTRFGASPERFHAECAVAAAEHPRRMIATSTHDTKRSEDVRARLAVLTEKPDEWAGAVNAWRDHHRRRGAGLIVDPTTEYAFYQNLVGAWPVDAARMSAYMEKATKEAKLNTSWIDPDEDYDERVRRFVETALSDETFRSKVAAFVASLEPAATINALAQKLVALTAPGIPDLYQGTELWDLSLVDPDNRRPVDCARSAAMLANAERVPASGTLGMDDGCAKLHIVKRALAARRERPELFGPGAAYRAVEAAGPHAHRVVAFLRGGGALTIVPRLTARMADWGDTTLEVPEGAWTDVLTGRSHNAGITRLDEILQPLPVALLLRHRAP